MTSQDEILQALDVELNESQKPECFTVEGVQQHGGVWTVSLSAASSGGRLDESLEGAYAWWRLEPNGAVVTADVLAVQPDGEFVLLRFLTGPAPSAGTALRIYPIRYLEKLKDLWSDTECAKKCLHWWESLAQRNTRTPDCSADPSLFPWLRRRQRQAFALPAWRTSFLWGPPGTGKTTTIGALLASLLRQKPATRILLLSTTNSAVDQAILAADRALEQITQSDPQASVLRRQCLRIGSHFHPDNYIGRDHLLPTPDFALLQRLVELHAHEPPKTDARRYAEWKATLESLETQTRQRALDALERARLAAMTTTSAAFRYADLRQLPQYDLVVFDEASQVSLAHALPLAQLGKRALVAGDPRQLAPIVKSKHPAAIQWLGKSPFERMPQTARYTCFLDEQSRMAPEICHIVSHTFYDGKLRVAKDKCTDRKWLSERAPFHVGPHGKHNAYLLKVDAEAKHSNKMGGWIRYETAEDTLQLVDSLVQTLQEDDILVITPYRAQRTLIRKKLRTAGYKHVRVSTVHRAQGSERDTVIFDPVAADNPFLNNPDLGPRLINVAVSRAMARFILFASPENRKNPLISQIASIIENSQQRHGADSIFDYIDRPDFPQCVIGKTIRIPRKKKPDLIVRIKGPDPSGTKLQGVNCTTGEPTLLSIKHLRSTFGCTH